jgi:23S rRNA (uridine2552-2'-O)-methyltransferase
MSAYDRKDATYRAARRAGLRSRAAPKLEELDRRFGLLTRGARVVDLGCWPGGWLQIAATKVGEGGLVVGVDFEPTDGLGLANVRTIAGDVADPQVRERLRDALGGPADIVLCDMAPKLSGVKVADRERHLALVRLAVEVAVEVLAPGGSAVIKLFSEAEQEATSVLRERFSSVTKYRPVGTRKGSSELYAIVGDARTERG